MMFSKLLSKRKANNILRVRLFYSVNRNGQYEYRQFEERPQFENPDCLPGLSYIHNAGKEPLQFTTLGKTLSRAADKWPGREAITSLPENVSLTFSQLLQKADQLAASFREIGIDKGDRVGVWAPNCLLWHLMNMAAARGGFILVALNPLYQKTEISTCIKKVQVKALIMPESFGQQNFYGMISDLAPELDRCQPGHLISDNLPSLKSLIVLSENELPGAFNLKSLLRRANSQAIQSVSSEQDLIQPDDIFCIQFSSGTTGTPKGVIVSHMGLVNSGIINVDWKGYGNFDQKICVQLPFYHLFNTVFCVSGACYYGFPLVIPSMRYDPEAIYKALFSEKCTTIHGTPTMFIDMLRKASQKGKEVSESLLLAVVGGAPSPPGLLSSLVSKLGFKDVINCFGMTELSGTLTLTSSMEENEIDNNVGRVIDHVEIKVIDLEGRVVPIGEQGELCVRGFNTTPGYWDDDAKTKEVIDSSGWLRTGDRFQLDADGNALIVGRIKDMINRGGENIYPKEIENVLCQHEDILEAQVFGVTDDRLGEEVCAAVILKDGSSVTLEKLTAYCHGKLARFKIPRHLRVVSSYPKTPVGKVKKYQLREMVESGRL